MQDILTLEPGERWEQAPYRKIDACDLYLLFWSSATRATDWVLRGAHFDPLLAARLRAKRRGQAGVKWHADET